MALIQANNWGDVIQFVKQRLKEKLKKYIHSNKREVKKALPTGKSYHVLFLHTSTKKDNEIISKISKELKDKGFQCCSCHDKSAKGFQQHIEKSLNVLVLISEDFKNNAWCMRTLDITNTKQLNEQIHFIIPVLYDAEQPEILCCIHSMDWSEDNFGVDKIAKTIDESIEEFQGGDPVTENQTNYGSLSKSKMRLVILFILSTTTWAILDWIIPCSVIDSPKDCCLHCLKVFLQCLIFWSYNIVYYIAYRRFAKVKVTVAMTTAQEDTELVKRFSIDVRLLEDTTSKSVPQTDQDNIQDSHHSKIPDTSEKSIPKPDTTLGENGIYNTPTVPHGNAHPSHNSSMWFDIFYGTLDDLYVSGLSKYCYSISMNIIDLILSLIVIYLFKRLFSWIY